MALSTHGDAEGAAQTLAEFLLRHPRVTVLTGAGCSTRSGIPDYRDENGNWKHREPMRYAQFVGERRNRQRYWAQSYSGWDRFSRAEPNSAHHALSSLERRGYLACLVTQNVDGLHQQAGSLSVIDLHGALRRVRCLSCSAQISRSTFQTALRRANPSWRAEVSSHRPDGDAKLSPVELDSFCVPDCGACGGMLKPDVVFFGESVPKDRVSTVYREVERSDALLVIGSSLMVYSGYRFVAAAHRANKPITIVNLGKTRADDLATAKLSGDCTNILTHASELLGLSSRTPSTNASFLIGEARKAR